MAPVSWACVVGATGGAGPCGGGVEGVLVVRGTPALVGVVVGIVVVEYVMVWCGDVCHVGPVFRRAWLCWGVVGM